MKLLVIGSGGREHALVWKIKQSPKVSEIFVAPGNAGTSEIAKNIPVSSSEEILAWVKENPVDLVLVAPDQHLADGLVDELQKINIPAFGPTKAASEIEWSKAFAKKFMLEEGIPTAEYETFTDLEKAKKYLENSSSPIVIKASGLALGKGVVIAETKEEALKTLDEMMQNKIFGNAGSEVVIEEFLEGREISVHAFSDGETVKMFPSSKDHKRIFENNQGPNTGGMGTIAPVPGIGDEDMKVIEEKIVIPCIQGLKKRGREFKGVLFPGVMLTKDGPKVIEFNARFGDPETQSYMRLLETDLVDIMFTCINGTLKDQEIKWSEKSACCIVTASGGYPGEYKKGIEIKGLDTVSNTIVFHAGTKLVDGKILTSGGRVLSVTSLENNLDEALQNAYEGVNKISFEGMQYRKDIGKY